MMQLLLFGFTTYCMRRVQISREPRRDGSVGKGALGGAVSHVNDSVTVRDGGCHWSLQN